MCIKFLKRCSLFVSILISTASQAQLPRMYFTDCTTVGISVATDPVVVNLKENT